MAIGSVNELLRTQLKSQGIPEPEIDGLNALLVEECPWLGTGDEVSEEIGRSLIEDALPPQWRSRLDPALLVDWHNGHARQLSGVDPDQANSQYEELVALVGQFGIEDGYGDGDYWVVPDSFSGRTPSIVMNRRGQFPKDLGAAIERWLAAQSSLSGVVVINEDGDTLYRATRLPVDLN